MIRVAPGFNPDLAASCPPSGVRLACRVPRDAALLLTTFVDPQRFDGTCYHAANWIVFGTTSGRGRDDRHRRVVCVPKRVLVYPLVADAVRRMRGQ